MRIVIDLQGAQSESRFRGIGRSSLALARAIARQRDEHEVFIALTGLLATAVLPVRNTFEGLLPPENIRVWWATGPTRACEAPNHARRKMAELLREGFLANLKPDIILITSLFEGYVDDAVTSIGRFDTHTLTAVLLHDLIPLLNPSEFLPADGQRELYFQQIGDLQKVDLLLAVSETSRQAALTHLKVPTENVVAISSAIDPHFCPQKLSDSTVAALRQRYRLTRKLVLYVPGGFDVRKNFTYLIAAYARLPENLRQSHQLVIASKVCDIERAALQKQARQMGLQGDELILTGYVPEADLIDLYRLATLFVFPSRYEGFGLPVLEAMACGAPVIGSNTTSIPEVIGHPDALFDPESVDAIRGLMQTALENPAFRQQRIEHGLRQAQRFSWDTTARRAINAMAACVTGKRTFVTTRSNQKRRRLAYISPLPPERTGIADYSAALLPALREYYDIDVVADQTDTSDDWIVEHCAIRQPQAFLEHASQYDRVLYHLGNSPFHHYMVALLEQVPGVVCLHDFFLSSYISFMELSDQVPFYWMHHLYAGHGYAAAAARWHHPTPEMLKYDYPCNFFAIQQSLGVMVHSQYACQLAENWYGRDVAANWSVIPLVRTLPDRNSTDAASFRHLASFKLPNTAFVVCSFGALDDTKLNHRLLQAWNGSALSQDPNCYLIFVGDAHGGAYGQQLTDLMHQSPSGNRIRVTGWVSAEVFQGFLARANLAVQLRTRSRGETSAAALDCLSHGVPTIVNAHGAGAELPSDAVWLLPDEFEDGELLTALETLRHNAELRNRLTFKAPKIIEQLHTPRTCAQRCHQALEHYYHQARTSRAALIHTLAARNDLPDTESELATLARQIARNQPDRQPARRLLIDVSATCRNPLPTGIERVTRCLLQHILQELPAGWRPEPVYLDQTASGNWCYRFARQFTLDMINCPASWTTDDIVEMQTGDLFFTADWSGEMLIAAARQGIYLQMRQLGIPVYVMVHDLLPMQMPQHFPAGTGAAFEAWLKTVCGVATGIIGVTRAVRADVASWLACQTGGTPSAITLHWSHHGADFNPPEGYATPDSHDPADDPGLQVESAMKTAITFLMVGTIEPRKGHLQALAAFEQLWREQIPINLVIVGAEGWPHLPDDQRRTIRQTIAALQSHPQTGQRLFWLHGISDVALNKLYAAAACLLAASEGEGFGLPLIEAARHHLPVLARDLPVFREVAEEHAAYFDNDTRPSVLAAAVKNWLQQYEKGTHPRSADLPWMTWRQSAQKLMGCLGIEVMDND